MQKNLKYKNKIQFEQRKKKNLFNQLQSNRHGMKIEIKKKKKLAQTQKIIFF